MRLGVNKSSLKDSKLIKQILNMGDNKIVTPIFLLFHKIDSSIPTSVSIIVSKKSAPRAVDRNFMRRRIRAIFSSLETPQGAYVIILRPAMKRSSFLNIQNTAVKAFKELPS